MSWTSFSGVELTPFEAETIREVCLTYLSSQQQYTEECHPPFLTNERKRKLAAIAEKSFMSS